MELPYHIPVLLETAIDGLAISPNGVYVDATFGGGGHSKAILDQIGPNGKLFAFDQDQDAYENIIDDERFIFVPSNFRFLSRFLKLNGIKEVDGILADLGVSSHQLDEAERGFSFRFEGPLDMRMNQHADTDAAAIINEYSAEQLQTLFSQYGEVRNAKTLAHTIVQSRHHHPFKKATDLLEVIEPIIKGQRKRYLAQVFQALRIEVNDEMSALETFFQESLEVLKPGGRMVVISYHSLEDRMTKQFFKTGNIKGEIKKDFYGNIFRPFKILTKKAILPDPEEIELNPRSRSAKLRIGEKIISA